jgi:Na+-transporting methylmalonyl-CoA/oxaloacetate decarboxylase gamma subunit
VVSRLLFGVALSDRPLFLIGILFLVLGLQIFAIGLIGEIIIFTHAKEIKEYTVEEIIN